MPNNNIEWGQGSVNNSIGWGSGAANNSRNWGWVHSRSYGHDETNLVGASPFYSDYKNRVEADGGTMYNTRACTNNKIQSLQAIELVGWDEVVAYQARVTGDSGTNYNTFFCTRKRLQNLISL